jgi:hypothetical protein
MDDEPRALWCLTCNKEIARSRNPELLDNEMHRHKRITGHGGYEDKTVKD